MNRQEVIEEFWNTLQRQDDDDEDVLLEAVNDLKEQYGDDACFLQELFNWKQDNMLPTEFICANYDSTTFTTEIRDAFNLIVEYGGQVTDACYRSLLRKDPTPILGLCSLMDSGYFPLQLGNTYTLDWIISTSNDRDGGDPKKDEEATDTNLERALFRLFEWKQQEFEAASSDDAKMIAGKAFESGKEFETWVQQNANSNHCGLSENKWYSKFNTSSPLTVDDDHKHQQIPEETAMSTATTPAIAGGKKSNSILSATPQPINDTGTTAVSTTRNSKKSSSSSPSPLLMMTNVGASYAVTPRNATTTVCIGTVGGAAGGTKKRPFITPTPAKSTKRVTRENM